MATAIAIASYKHTSHWPVQSGSLLSSPIYHTPTCTTASQLFSSRLFWLHWMSMWVLHAWQGFTATCHYNVHGIMQGLYPQEYLLHAYTCSVKTGIGAFIIIKISVLVLEYRCNRYTYTNRHNWLLLPSVHCTEGYLYQACTSINKVSKCHARLLSK